jgi:hypothetical protein
VFFEIPRYGYDAFYPALVSRNYVSNAIRLFIDAQEEHMIPWRGNPRICMPN